MTLVENSQVITWPKAAPVAGGQVGAPSGAEDSAWFDALHARLLAENRPKDAIAAHLVWRLALAMWRSERAARIEETMWQEGWTPARLNAIQRYQTVQQRELKEALRLLERRAKIAPPQVLEDEPAAEAEVPAGEELPAELAALADLAAWLVAEEHDRAAALPGSDHEVAELLGRLDAGLPANANQPAVITGSRSGQGRQPA